MESGLATVMTHHLVLQEHIDVYSHLNNANYGLYFEKGRVALQGSIGISDEVLIGRGLQLVVAESVYKYKKPVPPRANIDIISKFFAYTRGPAIESAHSMWFDSSPVATLEMKHVFKEIRTGAMLKEPPSWFLEAMRRHN